MKIAQFAKKFNVQKSTIRYYSDINLLIPDKEKNYFNYNNQCIKDMEDIIKLKSIGFSIKEIQSLKAYERFRKNYSTAEKEHLINIVKNKINFLEIQLASIKTQIKGLYDYKTDLKNIQYINTCYGLPFQALNYLTCPQCFNEFKIEEANIKNNMIFNGNLICSCGTTYIIKDGMIIDNLEKYNLIKKELNLKDIEKINLYEVSNEHILNIKKSGKKIVEFMENFDHSEGILFLNADCDLIIMDIEKFFRDHGVYFFISYDIYPVLLLKEKLEKMNINGNFIFMSVLDEIPLKKNMKCIIDNGGNICDMITGKKANFNISRLKNLVNLESKILSIHVGLLKKRSNLSLDDQRLNYLLKENHLKAFKDLGLNLLKESKIGNDIPPNIKKLYDGIEKLYLTSFELKKE